MTLALPQFRKDDPPTTSFASNDTKYFQHLRRKLKSEAPSTTRYEALWHLSTPCRKMQSLLAMASTHFAAENNTSIATCTEWQLQILGSPTCDRTGKRYGRERFTTSLASR
eukprot:5569726-Heterocapsa_arctica.AAC.1